MTSYVSIETEGNLGFDLEEVTNQVLQAVMEEEACPYDVTVNLTLTDNDEIQAVNASFRQIDRATDVLSFPNLHFETPGDFSEAEDHEADCFDPDTGELMLGDIMISEDKVREQAEAYGHSLKREFASENGTELNAILPKMSPLNPQYLTKKQSVFQKIVAFVEKFKGVGGEV